MTLFTLALNGAADALDYYLLYKHVTISKYTDVAAIPADPEVVEINFTSNYPNARFSVPTTDREGNNLLPSKLFYVIWVEKDGEQQQYTFTAARYPQDFTDDVTEVPYTHDGHDLYAGAARINSHHSDTL